MISYKSRPHFKELPFPDKQIACRASYIKLYSEKMQGAFIRAGAFISINMVVSERYDTHMEALKGL